MPSQGERGFCVVDWTSSFELLRLAGICKIGRQALNVNFYLVEGAESGWSCLPQSSKSNAVELYSALCFCIR